MRSCLFLVALTLGIASACGADDGARAGRWRPEAEDAEQSCGLEYATWCPKLRIGDWPTSTAHQLRLDRGGVPLVAGLAGVDRDHLRPYVRRYEPNGDERWTWVGDAELSWFGSHRLVKLKFDGHGGIVLMVMVHSRVHTGASVAGFIRLGVDGELLESFEASVQADDFFVDESGLLWVFGTQGDCSDGLPCSKLQGFDETGELRLEKTLVERAYPRSRYAMSVQRSTSGAFIVAGNRNGALWVAGYDTHLNLEWEYSDADFTHARVLAVGDDGRSLVQFDHRPGQCEPGDGENDCGVRAFNGSGELLKPTDRRPSFRELTKVLPDFYGGLGGAYGIDCGLEAYDLSGDMQIFFHFEAPLGEMTYCNAATLSPYQRSFQLFWVGQGPEGANDIGRALAVDLPFEEE